MKKSYDKIFLSSIIAITLFGFFVLSSAALGLAARDGRSPYSILFKQLIFGGGLGFGLFLITSKIPYKKWKKISLPLLLGSFFLALMVFVPHIGFEHGGAKRWLSIGSFTFQPAEILKFSFVLYLSSLLAKNKRQITSFKTGIMPFLIILGFVAGILIIQPDIGTLLVICCVATFLLFLAGAKIRHLGLIVLLGALVFGALLYTKPYLMSRLTVFMDSSHDLQGKGYQINQVKIAMGSGGLWGRGFGEGLAKFNYLPEPMGDSVFAVIGEELGFAGTSFLVFLFIFILYKSFHIAYRAPDVFGRLLVSGIAILIILQAFINMYAITGLMPLTGLPLLFISQGGSALLFTLAEVGIILNVSKSV